MKLNLTILSWMIALAMLQVSAAATYPIALPGCKSMCGNVPVPYPFGIGVSSEAGQNCFLDETFSLTCNTSTLLYGNVEVQNISPQGQLDLSFFVGRSCYNETGKVADRSNSPTLWTGAFTINNTENKFISVGCNSYGYLNSYRSGKQYSTGCLTRCLDGTDEENSNTCSGIGCCQVDIPAGMQNISIEANSFHDQPLDFNNCSYAFIAKQNWYNFSTDHITKSLPYDHAPLVVDWDIGNETCDVASSQPDFACKNNSNCEDTEDGHGYRCGCKKGYDGNPYLPDGCQNINECLLSKHNCTNAEYCEDMEGSFKCRNGTERSGSRRKHLLAKIAIVMHILFLVLFLSPIS